MTKQIEKQLFAMAREMGLLHKNLKVSLVPINKETNTIVDIRIYFSKDIYISVIGSTEQESDYVIPFFNLCLLAQKYLSLYAMQAISEGYKVDKITAAPFSYSKAGLSDNILAKLDIEEIQSKHQQLVKQINKLDKKQLCK